MCRSCGVVAAAASPGLSGSLNLVDAIPFAVDRKTGVVDDTDVLRQWGVAGTAHLPLERGGAAFHAASAAAESGAYSLLSALLLSSGYGHLGGNEEAHIESCLSAALNSCCCGLQSGNAQERPTSGVPSALCGNTATYCCGGVASLVPAAAGAQKQQQQSSHDLATTAATIAAVEVVSETTAPTQFLSPDVAQPPAGTHSGEQPVRSSSSSSSPLLSAAAAASQSTATTVTAGRSYTKKFYILDFSSVLQDHWLNATTSRGHTSSQNRRKKVPLTCHKLMSETRYIPINHCGSILQHITPFEEIGNRSGAAKEQPRQQRHDVGVTKTSAGAAAVTENTTCTCSSETAPAATNASSGGVPPASSEAKVAAARSIAQPLARVARVSMLESLNQMSRHEILEAIFAHNAFANVRECRRLIHAYLAANETRLPTSELRKLFYIISAVPKDTLFGWVSGIGDLPTKRLAPVTCFEENPSQSLTAAEVAVRDLSSRDNNNCPQSSPAMQRLWQTHFPLGNQLLKFISFSHPKLLTTCSYDEAWQVLAALKRARGVRYSRRDGLAPPRASRPLEALI